MTTRKELVGAITEQFTALRSGVYAVRQGDVNMANWDLEKFPRLAYLTIDEGRIGVIEDCVSLDTVVLGLHLVSRFKRQRENESIDDDIQQEMFDDAMDVVKGLLLARKDNGQSYMSGIDEADFTEFDSFGLKFQGLTVTLTVRI